MFGGVMLWEATFSDNNLINGMSYAENIKKDMESCSCASQPTATSTTVTSSTLSSSSILTVTTSSVSSSSESHPTDPTSTTSHPITTSSTYVESSSSSSHATTYDDLTASSTIDTSPSDVPASCGIRGYDKTRAYNFLNDLTYANFEKCSARCAADESCYSFAFGVAQCLLYDQSV